MKRFPRTTISGASTLISVPKKKIKKAVHRNRIKRLIRESYRLNKTGLLSCGALKDYDLLVAFIYLGTGACCFRDVEISMKNALKALKEKLD